MSREGSVRGVRTPFLLIVILLTIVFVAGSAGAVPDYASTVERNAKATPASRLAGPLEKPISPGQSIVEAQLIDGRRITRVVDNDPDQPVRVLVQLSGEPAAVFSASQFDRSQGLSSEEVSALDEHRHSLAAERQAFLDAVDRSGAQVEVLAEFDTLLSAMTLLVDREDIPLLQTLPGVRAVEEDRRLEIMVDESVPLIGAPDVWDMEDAHGQAVTGLGMRIAIIDTGIDYDHPDLGGCFGTGCRVAGGYDFANGDNDPMDDNGHGTHVAGITAAKGEIQGVAPDATMLAYKVCDSGGSCWSTNIIAALEAAIDPDGNAATADGAHVANVSLGSAYGNPDDIQCQAVDNAVVAGMVVAVAAGNDHWHHTIGSPGGSRDAITVAASDREDHITDFSSRGPIMGFYDVLKPDIAAPGFDILSTASSEGSLSDPGGYIRLSGTSMATPHVTGAVALLRQLHQDWSPATIKSALMGNAVDLGETQFHQGAGRLNVHAAAQETVVTTASVGFGLPLLDGATDAIVTLTNSGSTSLQVSLEVEAARFMDGALKALSPAQPVDHVSLSASSLSLPAGGSKTVRMDLDLPADLADGYYGGVIRVEWPGGETQLHFLYTALGRLTVHLVDELGEPITEYQYDLLVVIGRYSPDTNFAYSNWAPGINAAPPFTFFVPPGQYVAQAIDRYFPHDECWADPPESTWLTPYLLMETTDTALLQPRSVYLSLQDAKRTTIIADSTESTPVWISNLRLHYVVDSLRMGLTASTLDGACPTRYLAQLSARHDVLLNQPSDGPGQIEFSAQAYAFSENWREMLVRSPGEWHECLQPCPPGEDASNGVTLSNKADVRYIHEWLMPAGSTFPDQLILADEETTHYQATFDIPGTIRFPHLSNLNNNDVSARVAEAFLPTDGLSIGGKTIGLRQDVFAHGRVFMSGFSESHSESPYFFREFYERNPADAMPAEWFEGFLEVPLSGLSPLPPTSSETTFGGGPFYPAATFDNRADSIRLVYPVLGASGGNGVVPLDSMNATLEVQFYLDDQYYWGESLNYASMYLPALIKPFPLDAPGNWKAIITSQNDQIVGHDLVIEARFAKPAADMNPPRVLDLIMPQRFDEDRLLPVTIRVTDPESGITSVDGKLSRDGGETWQPLPLTADGDAWSGNIIPGNETEIGLQFIVIDGAGNELRFEELGAAVRETPVNLNLALSSTLLPFRNEPVMLGITGSLLLENGDPLSPDGLVPISVYLNDEFAGYIHERARQANGTIRPGQIDFDWTFVPTDFVAAPGDYPLTFVFDLGTYQHTEITATLRFREMPQAMNDRYFTIAGTTLSIPEPGVLVNDYIPPGNQSSAQLLEAPEHGSLTLDISGAFSYVPNHGYEGNDSFRYRVLSEISSAPATVTITVGKIRLALPYIVR